MDQILVTRVSCDFRIYKNALGSHSLRRGLSWTKKELI